MIRLFTLLLFLCTITHELSSQTDTLLTDSVNELLISATRIPSRLNSSPASISVIKGDETFKIKQQLSLQEYTRSVPGLFTLNANNLAQDLRISIRGFGSRAAFGIRGIKLIVDGVPETTPDGQGQLDNLDLGIVNSIEVLRGPSSSLYGNASGGVINISTIDQIDESYSQAGIDFGSYGMQQYQLSKGISAQNTTALLHGSYTRSNGYRVQSGFQNFNFNAKLAHQLNETSNIKFGFSFSDSPQADDPGGINLESVVADRRQARDRNLTFKTGEEIRQIKSSLQYAKSFGESMDVSSYAFFATRDFFGKLPFGFGGMVDLSRGYGGHGTSLTFQKISARMVNKLQFGYDIALQRDSRQRFFNNEGVQGDLTFDQQESFTIIGLYAVDHYQFDRFFINAGLRFDLNRLSAKDKILTNGDNSGSINLSSINPSLGLSYQLGNSNYIFTNISTSFETPTLSELSNNPNGMEGLNPDLKAQQSRNLEIGIKGSYHEGKDKGINYELAVFHISTRNDLVPYELEAFPDRDFFRNAGQSIRFGVESSIDYRFAHGWSGNLSYTYSDFKYESYSLPSGDFSGNQLPGLPKSYAVIGLSKSGTKGLLLSMQYIITGELYANDKNDALVSQNSIVNLNLGYQILRENIKLIPHFGINNLTNTDYNDNIRINAFGSRYYEPAPGRNFFGGLKINF